MKRINYYMSIIAVSMALIFCSTSTLAQDDGPRKRQNVEYVRVNFTEYKLDKRDEARGIIEDHFVPANEAAGTPGPMRALHLQTGKWDTITIWALEEGMTEMEWTRTSPPNFIKWKAALDEQVGGEDEGWALINQFRAAIAHRTIEVGHHHVSDEE